MDKIREQNKLRQRRYYDAHRELILERRRAKQHGTPPPISTEIKEQPYKLSLINKINDKINILEKEINELKNKYNIKNDEEEKYYEYNLEGAINLIKDNVKNINSQKNYLINTKIIFNILDNTDNIFVKLKNYKNVINKIKTSTQLNKNDIYSKNSQKQFFQTILKLISLYNMPLSKKIINSYTKEFEILKIESSEQTEKKTNEIELLDYDEYMNKIKDFYGEDSKQYLITVLYKINTFRDDLGEMMIKENNKDIDTNKNYIIVDKIKSKNVYILLNQYKTVNKYGPKIIKITKTYSKLIRNYIINNNLEYGDYLFNTKNLSKYISNMNKKINLNYTINTLRKMKISSGYNDETIDASKKLQIAEDAHHNSTTSSKVYKHKIKK